MRLKKIIEIKTILHCDTGLRIGGSKDSLEIGGNDNPIIRHPLTNLPYIPGSSLKGKIRSLLEGVYGRKVVNFDHKTRQTVLRDEIKGEPCGCGQCMVCRIFGAHKNMRHNLGPTRIIFRDASLIAETEEALKQAQVEKGIFFSEIKTENIINRNIGNAQHPRPNERVPAGAQFQVEMMLKIYDKDNEEQLIQFVKQGMSLLEKDYLGSSGSRGYGKVTFIDTQFFSRNVDEVIQLKGE